MNAKKGLAFVTTSPTDAKVDSALLGGKQGAAWYYSWRPVSPVADAHGAEFVPMLWDASQANWTALQANYPPDYAGWIMGPNEPNHPQQAAMLPTEAAICWHQLREAYPLARLVAPAPWDRPLRDSKTGEWGSEGDHWLTEWREAHWRLYNCYPDPDAYALHYYTGKDPFRAVVRFYMEWIYHNDARPGVHIWLTEFRFCNEWWEGVPGFDLALYMRQQIRAMEKLPYLDRWAYFANREYLADPIVSNDNCHIGLNTDEGLTNLGKVFMSL